MIVCVCIVKEKKEKKIIYWKREFIDNTKTGKDKEPECKRGERRERERCGGMQSEGERYWERGKEIERN